ncbi:MAG: efflux RND transporter periplasmic adaptor subunit [Sulfurimonas sp.]|uniref:efflux RND transporter periplasmic adaptor subunit n=1 Tax=Sulfurimonas sp. TaxID=2022749 RepID=UPI00260F323A|nr:efflux RND transporter periplasmic adaptor subunit [Sulfurimonas sp.]MCW8894625.1 efflux RND transporter periplasmic adaptor subunit [Sulfurimonas sp.]MCW8955070.1 efflux RND transporter periplasmic adaptor subunit [Sulfurimonas sp.]MCW9066810.1 efflux RND transporter periplasmic adaptor subunit [Sulfurimonas sp.]
MKHLIILLSLLLTLEAKPVTVEQLFSVQTTHVKKVKTAKVIKNYGYIKVDDSKRYSVTPRFGGYIEELYADTIYKYVKKGDVLATVYSPEVLRAKEEYLAHLKYSKKHSNGDILKSAKEKLELLHVDKNEIESIETNKKASRFTSVKSPVSGYLFVKNISNFDAFSAKQKLFEIVNLESVWVEVKVHQKELSRLEKMKFFTLRVVGSDDIFEAKKGILYPALDTKESTLTLRLHVNNQENFLKTGMYVTVESSSEKTELLTLPVTSVIRKNSSFYVFVTGEYAGEYEPKKVDVELLDSKTYIVLGGLSEGDEVVNNALFLMDSDAQINGLY